MVATQTEYGEPFASSVWKDHVFATQFHPEKSQKVGLQIPRPLGHRSYVVRVSKPGYCPQYWVAGVTEPATTGDAPWLLFGPPISREAAWRRMWRVWLVALLRELWLPIRYAVGAQVCKRYGHSKDVQVQEHVHGEWCPHRQQWLDIDGASVEWFCPRCGDGGRSYW